MAKAKLRKAGAFKENRQLPTARTCRETNMRLILNRVTARFDCSALPVFRPQSNPITITMSGRRKDLGTTKLTRKPAISDEETSDIEVASAPVKRSSREKSTSAKVEDVEPEQEEEAADEDEEGGDEEEDMYACRRIAHTC